MKKYLVALVVGIGLMANGSAFASSTVFNELSGLAPLSECFSAAKEGIEVDSVELDYGVTHRRYLVEAVANDHLSLEWRIYTMIIAERKSISVPTLGCVYSEQVN